MALVMLPCDLPWWTSVQRHLKHLLLASSSQKLVAGMLKLHDMCNIGLDPEEDSKEPELLKGLEVFLEEELAAEERQHFLDNTLRVLVTRALHLRRWKPAKGLVFSLQQQSDVTELDYNFVSSLIAHSFFSSFPKRTLKTHPTLQDFNFTHFFKNLHRKSQRCKLKSLMHYFEWLDQNETEGSIKITRKVMTAKQWLTIEDWSECSLPLCKLLVRHEGRPERCDMEDAMRVCFASSRLGGDALLDGESQESLSMFMMPELLAALLSVEALEDNEVVVVEGARLFSRITDRNKGSVDTLEQPKQVTICMMDAENYRQVPLSQWEEDNMLRELNKCLLAFQQSPSGAGGRDNQRLHERRLSPIGESFSHTPPEVEATVMVKQSSCSTINSYHSRSPTPDTYCAATLNLNDPSIEITKSKCWLSPDSNTLNNRRGRFIVLGSSGECLPVSRGAGAGAAADPRLQQEDSLYSSCNSSDDEFHSANGSFDDGSEDEGRGASGRPGRFQYGKELSTEARRLSFAGRLRDALRREAEESSSCTSSTGHCSTDSSSYAVGISISGAELDDHDIRVKRGGSVGFVLTEQESVSNGAHSPAPRRRPSCLRRDTGNSSKYSFSTEYSSELEEMYEQFNQWLDDPIVDAESGEHKPRELDSRDMAVIRFAGSLLKRTLSESFAGMPLTEGCAHAVGMETSGLYPPHGGAARDRERERDRPSRHKLVLTARSLSLELAKHKHRLAAQLLSQLAQKMVSGGSCRPVATGNWGCGRRQKGHPQLKLLTQWLAASVAGVPALLYYTAGNQQLFKLDTLVRVLVDRKWTVGQLTRALLRFAHQVLHEPGAIPDDHSLFEELIGIEKVTDDL